MTVVKGKGKRNVCCVALVQRVKKPEDGGREYAQCNSPPVCLVEAKQIEHGPKKSHAVKLIVSRLIPIAICSVLIRPDGIIAWVSENEHDNGGLRTAADRWFIRKREIKY